MPHPRVGLRAARRTLVLLTCLLPATTSAQALGAVALHRNVRDVTVTSRVLVVGAYPGSEDGRLVSYLARGRGVEVGVLSLTRGEAGTNALGPESGDALGAIRVEEALAARQIDGARQFFTRAYDFGFARSDSAAFQRWPRDELLGDVVAIVRSFRPHVVVVMHTHRSRRAADGIAVAAASLVRDAFDAAADTTRFSSQPFGAPWSALRLYGIQYLLGAYDRFDAVAGGSTAEVAEAAASRHRTQAQPNRLSFLPRGVPNLYPTLLASRVAPASERPDDLLHGVDTTFARLMEGTDPSTARLLQSFARVADSTRANLDVGRPGRSLHLLASLVAIADSLRESIPRCRHPAFDPAPVLGSSACDAAALDRDASVDIARRRAIDALVAASGVRIEATADREELAYGDDMPVSVLVRNYGEVPVAISQVRFSGVRGGDRQVVVLPDSMIVLSQFVSGLPDAHPWWMGTRLQDLHPPRQSPGDGLARVATAGGGMLPSVAVPADYRRLSDITLTLTMAGTTFTTSVGAVTHGSASATLGRQENPVAGVPPVTLQFAQTLEWMPTGAAIDRVVSLQLRSHTDQPRTFALQVVAPRGLRVDSLPRSITLAPREHRELLLRVRGALEPGRHEFGVIGANEDGSKFAEGFRTIRHPHIRPVRLHRSSAFYIQAAEVSLPRGLTVAWVRGAGDASPSALRQLGVSLTEIDAAEFPLLDLARYSTIVIGPRALDNTPQLLAFRQRLVDFTRAGGTLVVQHGEVTSALQQLLPHELGWNVTAERVTNATAPVRVLDSTHPLLASPNRIRPADWDGWTQDRALGMPTLIDPRYASPLEVHDPGERENRGALLTANVGKGRVVFTTFTFSRQLAAGVPGAARLLVNLLSPPARTP